MKTTRVYLVALPAAVVLAGATLLIGGSGLARNTDPLPSAVSPDVMAALLAGGSGAHPFSLNHHRISLTWGITGGEEKGCGGTKIAGGELSGNGEFTQLGNSSVSFSAAWDIDHLLQGPGRFIPTGPASGPIAPVLGRDSYPYSFHYDPAAGGCGSGPTATGQLTLVTANGDRVYGRVVGGETYKLRFLIDGDGIESFTITDVTGGTGRFDGARGAFVAHTLARATLTGGFDLDLVEILPGGTLNR